MKQDWEIYRDTGILGAYRPEPVSYTHLDVYKRQLHKRLMTFLRSIHRTSPAFAG